MSASVPPALSPSQCVLLTGGALSAATLPTLLAFNLPPSATFFNQVAALVGWGGWTCVLALWMLERRTLRGLTARTATAHLWVVLLGLAATVCWSGLHHALPRGLLCSALGMLAAVGVTLALGETVVRAGWAKPVFTALCQALLAAAVLNTLIALVQVFAPQLADGVWIAGTSASIAGRAAGNLRQPNHLSSLLLWGLAGWVWLQRDGYRHRQQLPAFVAMVGVALMLCVGLVLSGSRTGTLGLLMLAAWGALDRRLAREVRWVLMAAPLVYALLWWGWGAWSAAEHQHFGGEGRFSLQGDVSASRFGIWANTWALVREHPWGGVGWGGFNFAWTLTPFPGRPVAFFDHVHNLPLHFAVELGVPLALLVCVLLGHALWRAVRAGWQVQGEAGVMAAAAAVMVLVMALHSQLEYPLWYAYFLLPTGFLWGLGLALGRFAGPEKPSQATHPSTGSQETVPSATGLACGAHQPPPQPSSSGGGGPLLPPLGEGWDGGAASAGRHLLHRSGRTDGMPARDASAGAQGGQGGRNWQLGGVAVAGLLLAIGGSLATLDYLRVAAIFAPPRHAGPLAERILAGQASWFFNHHADYAAATNDPRPETQMSALAVATHNLLDTRLMIAWAQALAAQGDLERARYLAQRLREFGRSEEFFEVCDDTDEEGAPRPFQCEQPTRPLRFEDFLVGQKK